MLGHPALLDQPGDIVDVDLAPDALLPARRVALQEAFVVEALAEAVDPAPAQHDVDRLLGRDRLQARTDLVDLDPDLVGLVVVLAEPLVEALGRLEFANLGGIDLDRRHQGSTRFIHLAVACASWLSLASSLAMTRMAVFQVAVLAELDLGLDALRAACGRRRCPWSASRRCRAAGGRGPRRPGRCLRRPPRAWPARPARPGVVDDLRPAIGVHGDVVPGRHLDARRVPGRRDIGVRAPEQRE